MINGIRKYISDKFSSFSLTEHIDPFNNENIPSSILDRGFHQIIQTITGDSKNQESQGLIVTIEVKVFLKGFRNPSEALAQSVDLAEDIVSSVVSVQNSTIYRDVKTIDLRSLNFVSYDEATNDNIVCSVFVFDFLGYICN